MDLSNLKPAEGSTKNTKRIGRGEGSGYGGTSGRGHKGAKSRSGYKIKRGFEGGQMPLQRRVPKFGFTNPNRVVYKAINLDAIELIATEKKIEVFTPEVFANNGLCGKNERIKVLGRGDLKSKVKISAHAFSASAKAAIEQQGGEATQI